MTGVFVRVVGRVLIRHDMQVVTDSLHSVAEVLWLDWVGKAHHAVPVAKLTAALSTSGWRESTRSTRDAHDAQVIPSTSKVMSGRASSTSVNQSPRIPDPRWR